jgi:hypothetical protein
VGKSEAIGVGGDIEGGETVGDSDFVVLEGISINCASRLLHEVKKTQIEISKANLVNFFNKMILLHKATQLCFIQRHTVKCPCAGCYKAQAWTQRCITSYVLQKIDHVL